MRAIRLALQQPRRQRGLTAIELLVTIAILAILLGIAAPSMSRFIGQWRASNAVNSLTGSLRTARTEAIARARPVVVCRVASSSSTTCLSTAGTSGFASGWIVFVNNDREDTSFDYSNGDELLLRQEAPSGIANITLTNAGRFVFLPNGLLNATTGNGVDIEAAGFTDASTTPWLRKALCITKPGRIRSVASSADCGDNEG